MIGERLGPRNKIIDAAVQSERLQRLAEIGLSAIASGLGRIAIENGCSLQTSLKELNRATPKNERRDGRYKSIHEAAYRELLPYIDRLGITETE